MCGASYSLYSLTQTTYQNRLISGADEIDSRLFYFISDKPYIAEICKTKIMTLFSLSWFPLENVLVFQNNMQ